MSHISEKAANGEIGSSSRERRSNLRFPFTASVEVTESKSGARITGRASDLGLGGCYVDAINPFPAGTNATIRIVRGKESFEAQAKIVYSQIGMGMGIAFVAAKQKQVRLFQRWILEISGKAVPELDATETIKTEASGKSSKNEERNYVLNELLIALMRKGVLTTEEGNAMLKKLLQ